MLTLRARWVLPIVGPPLDEGWVTVDGARMVDYGRERRARPRDGRHERHLGRVALMPALVNAHTHLELSYLRGRVGPASRFTDWVRELMRLRRAQADAAAPPIVDAAVQALAEARATGTALIGDVSNTLVTVPLFERASMAAHVFFEVLRFRTAEAEQVWTATMERLQQVPALARVRVSPAPHAPYSVSEPLLRRIRRHLARGEGVRTSVHLAESVEEGELLSSGSGAWRDLLNELGAWDADWTPPGCTPAAYLDRLELLGPQTLVVHGVHLTSDDLARVVRGQATIVTCPRSNRHVGVGDPPVARFYAAGARVAVGTDSLASAPDLNVFEELATLHRLAPDVPSRRLLESATRTGASALGFDDLGIMARGARAALIAVDVPEDVEDVEEYLVSGVPPERVHWPVSGA